MRKYVVGKYAVYYTVILLRSALHDCNNMPGLYHTNTGVVLIKNSVWKKKLSAKMTGLFKCSQNYFEFLMDKNVIIKVLQQRVLFSKQTYLVLLLFSLEEYTIIITLQ